MSLRVFSTLLLLGTILVPGFATGAAFLPDTPDDLGTVGTHTSIAIDANDAVHISYRDEGSGFLLYAMKAGGTWTLEQVQADGVNSVGEYSSIAIGPDGTPSISYYDATNQALKYAVRSGGIWILETVPTGSIQAGQYSSLAVDANGDPHIAYRDAELDELRYAVKSGGTWSFETVDSGGAGYYNSLRLDAYGRPHLASYKIATSRIRYAVRNGGVWAVEDADDSGSAVGHVSLALDAYGNPMMAYSRSDIGLAFATPNAGGGWNVVGVDAFNVFYISLAVDRDGTPHISYMAQLAGNEELKYAVKIGGVWDAATLDLGTEVTGFYTSIALDSEGDPHISYYDATLGDLRYQEGVVLRARHVEPGAARNTAPVTFEVYGSHVDSGTPSLTLSGPGPAITATSWTVIDSSRIDATFNLTGAALGVWDLTMTNALGTDVLQDAVVIYEDPVTLTRVTTSPTGDRFPDFPGPLAPHDSLAFVSGRGGGSDIYIKATTAGDYLSARRITDVGQASRLSWAPDAERLVFENTTEGQIYTVDADSGLVLGPVLLVTAADGDHDPAWSPLGDRIAFWRLVVDAGTIRTINPDGSGFTTLTNPLSGQTDFAPAWSPDGARIVFSRAPAGISGTMILSMSAELGEDGGLDTLVANNGAYNVAADWSPDGRWIAFSSDVGGTFDIYVMPSTSGAAGGMYQLTTDGSNGELAWTLDGTGIVFSSVRDGAADLFLATDLPLFDDTDGDGIPDGIDECPLEAPSLGEVDRDYDGCVDLTSSFRFVKFWSADQMPVIYETDLAGDPRIGDDSEFAALAAGFAAWTAVPGVDLAGGDDGTRGGPSNAVSGDERNSVSFSDPDGFIPGVLATTFVTYALEDTLIGGRTYRPGEIVDADLAFNTLQFAFSTDTYNAGPGSWDLQSLATHEFGHLFGFSHASIPEATMFYVVPLDQSFRTLEEDDVVLARRGYADGAIGLTIQGHVYRPDGVTPVAGAAVLAIADATGDTLQMTITGTDGHFRFFEVSENFRIWTQPVNGGPEIFGLTAHAINPDLESVVESDFLPEFWDIPEDNQDFGAPGYLVEVPYIHGVDPAIILNADLTGPQVVSTTPAVADTGVSVVGAILVKFDEKIDLATVGLPGALSLTNLSTTAGVGGAGALLQRDSLLVFTPSSALDYLTPYELVLGPPVADIFGNEMTAPVTVNFQTQSQPPVTITALSPPEVPVGGALVIHGTGFSSVAANNVVSFAGPASAVPYAATPDRLFVTVPPGAITGLVTVEVNAVTSNPFPLTVLPPALPPQASLVDDVALGGGPRKIAIKTGGAYAYVATDAGVDVVDALPASATFLDVSSLAVPGGCTGVVALPDGRRALAVGPLQPRLHVINTDPAAGPVFHTIVQDTALADPPLGIAVVPGGAEVLIAYADRVVMHAAAAGPLFGQELRQWTASGYGFRGDLAVAPGAQEAYATTTDGKVAVLGLLPGEGVVTDLLAGTSPGEAAANPRGGSALVVDGAGSVTQFAARGPVQATVPLSGGFSGLAMSPEGSFAYAANYTLNRVDVLDLAGNAPAVAEQFATGVDPRDLATGSAGRYVYVITSGQNRFEVYDTRQGPRITAVSPQMGGPGTLVTISGTGFDPVAANNSVEIGGQTVTPGFVFDAGTMLVLVQPASAVTGVVRVTVGTEISNARPYKVLPRPDAGVFELTRGARTGGPDPEGLVMTPSGRLLLAYHPDGSLTATRGDPSALDFHRVVQVLPPAATGLTGPAAMAITPDGDKLYVADSTASLVAVFSVDEDAVAPLAKVGVIHSGGGPLVTPATSLAVTPHGMRLFVVARDTNELLEVSTVGDSVLASLPGFVLPEQVIIGPAGKYAYVTDANSGVPASPWAVHLVDIEVPSPTYRTTVATVVLPVNAYTTHQLAAHPNGTRVYAAVGVVNPVPTNEVFAIDTDPTSPTYLEIVATIGSLDLGPGANAPIMIPNHGGTLLCLVDANAGTEAVYDPADLSLLDTGPVDPVLQTARAAVLSLDDARLYADGPADSILVTDLTPVVSLAFDSGAGQTAAAGQPLAAPLVVQTQTPSPLLEGSVVWFTAHPATGGDFGFGDQRLITAADSTGRVRAAYTAGTGATPDTVTANSAAGSVATEIAVVANPGLIPPEALAVSPGAANPPGVNTPIVVDFSKAMDVSTVSASTYTLRLAGTTTPLSGYFTTAHQGRRVVFQPLAPLDYAVSYEIVLTAGLADIDGNPLSNPGTHPFATAAAPALALHAVDAPAARVGDPVVLSGQGFAAAPSGNTVLFGTTSAMPFQADPGALSVKVPLGATGGTVRVVVGPDSSNAKSFAVLTPAVPTNQEIAQVSVPTSGQQIVVVPDGSRAYMTSPGANSVVPILIAAQTSETPVPVGLHPYGVTDSPSGDRIYATNFFSNDVSVVDADPSHTATFQKVIATIPTGLYPSGIAAHPDGRTLYVANYGDSTLSILDTDSTSAAPYSARATIPVDNSTQTVVVTPDGGRIIVGTATGLLIIDADDTSARQSITTNNSTQSVAVTPDGGLAVILTTDGTLIVIDIVPNSPTEGQARATIPTDKNSSSVAVSPDGALVYVTTGDGTVLVYQIVQVGGSGASAGEPLAASYQLVPLQEIEVGENPTGLAFDPSGSGLLLVVNSGSKTVSFINVSPATIAVPSILDLTPNTLNLKSNGKTVTAFLQFPTFLDPAGVDPASVRLEGVLMPDTTSGEVVEHNGDGILEFKLKFSRPEVFAVLQQGQQVPVTVTGLVEGTPFTATDTVRVIRPHVRWPEAGCLVPAGTDCEILWDPIQDGPADHVDIFWSHDDGASWDTVATGVPDDSLHVWSVPDIFSTQCLILVVARDHKNEVLGIGGVDESFMVGRNSGGVPTLPVRFALLPAAPNPFASATRIGFDLPEAREVSLDIYGIDGALVRRLAHDRLYPAGRHSVFWNGVNDRGIRVSAGVYFLQIRAGRDEAVRKLVRVQ